MMIMIGITLRAGGKSEPVEPFQRHDSLSAVPSSFRIASRSTRA